MKYFFLIIYDIISSTSSILQSKSEVNDIKTEESINMSPLPETYDIDKSNDPNINIQWFSSRLLEGLLDVFIIIL